MLAMQVVIVDITREQQPSIGNIWVNSANGKTYILTEVNMIPNSIQYSYIPPKYDGPIANDVKVGYKFREEPTFLCDRDQWLNNLKYPQPDFTFRPYQINLERTARITNDYWQVNLRCGYEDFKLNTLQL